MKENKQTTQTLDQKLLDDVDEDHSPPLEGEVEVATPEERGNMRRREGLGGFRRAGKVGQGRGSRRGRGRGAQGERGVGKGEAGERGQRIRALIAKFKDQGVESLSDEERKELRRAVIMRRMRQKEEGGEGERKLPPQAMEKIRKRFSEGRGNNGEEGAAGKFTPEQREKFRNMLAKQRKEKS